MKWHNYITMDNLINQDSKKTIKEKQIPFYNMLLKVGISKNIESIQVDVSELILAKLNEKLTQ